MSLQPHWLSRLCRHAFAQHGQQQCERAPRQGCAPAQSLSRDDARVLKWRAKVAKHTCRAATHRFLARRAQTMLAIFCCRRHSDLGFGQSCQEPSTTGPSWRCDPTFFFSLRAGISKLGRRVRSVARLGVATASLAASRGIGVDRNHRWRVPRYPQFFSGGACTVNWRTRTSSATVTLEWSRLGIPSTQF